MFPGFTKDRQRVPRQYLLEPTNKATIGAGLSTKARRSPQTKFDDSTVGKRKGIVLDLNKVPAEDEETLELPLQDREDGKTKNKCSSLKKKLALDLNDVVTEEEEERESAFDEGRGEKINKRPMLKKKFVYDLSDVVREKEEKVLESLLEDGLKGKINERFSYKNRVFPRQNDVVREKDEEARESPFDNGGSEKKSKRSSLKRVGGDVNSQNRREKSCLNTHLPGSTLNLAFSHEDVEIAEILVNLRKKKCYKNRGRRSNL
ncbi:unnamed protein product [Sphenostylis stenocarpa]|uniref:Uncharacterized protein n=1 Tax=Sphenostylis stenocarpa TaxID=92480 RepID=A0AA86VEM5_9FABA|nr:unnamed protein product [Sphenostylis stenocarpa]